MKLLVLSIDAMFSGDIARLRERPALAPFFSRCLLAEEMRPIYPALTYPCHVSIVSGNFPAVHGVYHNLACAPGARYQDWKWYYREVRCPTLFDDFRAAGYTTGAVFWPVSALAPVDYLVPEIWSYTDDPVERIVATCGGATEHIIRRHCEDVDFTSKFRLDRFARDCAADIVDEFDPDVLFLHFSLLDAARHGYGIRHEKVDEALEQCALWLEEVLEHAARKGSLSDLSLAILGDHGHLNCRASLSMNRLFARRGWLSLPIPARLEECGVFCHAAGVSAQVYLRDRALAPALEQLFDELKSGGYLYAWYSRDEAARHGLCGPFDYVLEGGDGYFFVDAVTEQFVTAVQAKDGGDRIGKHGHFPLRGDRTAFALSAPGLESRRVSGRCITDIAPTIGALFGLPARPMQGENLLASGCAVAAQHGEE